MLGIIGASRHYVKKHNPNTKHIREYGYFKKLNIGVQNFEVTNIIILSTNIFL